jgi:hypothetical protein
VEGDTWAYARVWVHTCLRLQLVGIPQQSGCGECLPFGEEGRGLGTGLGFPLPVAVTYQCEAPGMHNVWGRSMHAGASQLW